MQINFSKSKYFLFALVFAVLLLAVAIAPNGGVNALADNSSDIGQSGANLEIADITARENGLDYSSQTTGRTLKITMPFSVTHLYVAFEVDIGYDLWAIKGEEDIDDDIPYIEIVDEQKNFTVTDTMLNEIKSSWTAISELNGKKVCTLTVHFNGELYVTTTLEGETDRLSDTHIVKEIDCIAPVMKSGVPAHGLKNENGKYVISCTATFEDSSLTSTGGLYSARSGLQAISLIYSPYELSSIKQEDLGTLEILDGGYWEIITLGDMVPTKSLTFTLDRDGYYYYFIIDRMGNSFFGMMLGGKFDRTDYVDTDDRFMIYDDIGDVEYSVKAKMSSIGEELSEYDGKVESTIYQTTMEAYSTLLLKFYSRDYDNETLAEKKDLSKEYFNFVNTVYVTFKNALSIGATYTVEMLNGEIFQGEIKALNLNKETFPALSGATVVASFNVAKYDTKDVPEELITLAGLGEGARAYKLNYKLTANGLQANIPVSALIYEIVNLKGIDECKLFIKTESGYLLLNNENDLYFSEGKKYLRFSNALNAGEYYIVYTEESVAETLLPLWISLGAVGGVAIIGGAVVTILIKSGKIKLKKNKTKTVESQENIG